MAIKAVIFDIGGVLLVNDGREQAQKQDAQANVQMDEIFKFINRSGIGISATKGQLSVQELWSQVGERFKVDPQQIQALEAEGIATEKLNTELVDFLQSLRPRYKTALLSNAWPGARAALNAKYELDKLADVQIFSSEEGKIKPDANFYLIALMRLHVQANEAVFLDDKIVNVDGASVLGMNSIHYRNNKQAIADIKRILDRYAR
jgi:epoxide hydrolase-like predicted phosphatase